MHLNKSSRCKWKGIKPCVCHVAMNLLPKSSTTWSAQSTPRSLSLIPDLINAKNIENQSSHLPYTLLIYQSLLSKKLESTDAAGRLPHLRPMRPNAGHGIWCSYPRIGAASEFFFFLGFTPTQLDSHRIDFDWCRIGLIQPESGRIGHIGLYWPATDTAETGRKWVKSALKLVGTAEILTSVVFLAFFFLCFVNQGIVMCFLRIF